METLTSQLLGTATNLEKMPLYQNLIPHPDFLSHHTTIQNAS